MADNFITDSAASAAELNIIITALESYFNGKIISLEQSEESIAKFLDCSCGIDALVNCKDGTVFGIASRVRYRKYNDFGIRTIRKYRNNPKSFNIRTEIDHISRSGIKPRYHVNTCVLADGYHIAIAKTTEIADYIHNNYCDYYDNPDNGSQIKYVPYSKVDTTELYIPKKYRLRRFLNKTEVIRYEKI